MKKLLLLIIMLTVAAFSSFAQTNTATGGFSVGLTFGVPTSPANNTYGIASGLTGKYEFDNRGPVKLLVTSGLDIFPQKATKGKNIAFLPVEVGAKVYVRKFYFEGDVGASINTNSDVNYTGNKLGFMYSPVVGYTIPALDGQEIDFSLRYEARVDPLGTIGQIALRVAYKFDF